MSLARLLPALLIAALCGAVTCQTMPSSCNACTNLNRESVYDVGRPSVVWCSATAPTPSPIASSSGTCMPTAFLVQRPFRKPEGARIQCVSGNQAAPCPPTAPFASFAPCDCSLSCVGGEKEAASYLLRSCESCVALGANWMAGDDLVSASCRKPRALRNRYLAGCHRMSSGWMRAPS